MSAVNAPRFPTALGALFVLAALAGGPSAEAAPPLREEFNPGGRTCFIDTRAATLRAQGASGPSALGFPAPATPQVLVIRVDFTDLPMAAAAADTEAFFEKVRNFYLENSYGAFRPTFTVTSDLHTIGALAAFGQDCGSDIACRDPQLRIAALAAENNAGRDFTAFDQIMIYHAGTGQETTGVGNDIWSVFFPGNFLADGKTFNGFTVVPEREAGVIEALGVIVHEYGHQIGLPDLYDTSFAGGASTVGAWDVMDFPYTGTPGGPLGSNPPHFGAWSKMFLGFLTPETVSATGPVSLYSANVASAAVRVPLGTADNPSSEYLLIEYRRNASTSTFDRGLPGQGVLVWHIDDAIAMSALRLANNDVNTPSVSGRGHRGVDLVEADFTEFYTSGQRAGQRTDPFGNGGRVLPPSTDAFNRVASGVAITSIAGIGDETATFFLEPPAPNVATYAGSPLSVSVSATGGQLDVSLPAGALASPSAVFSASYTATTILALGSASAAADLTPSGVGFVLAAERNQAPVGAVAARFTLAGAPPFAGLTAEELSRLVLARYAPERNLWVPLPTVIDPGAGTATASLDRLSIVQVMSATPGTAPAEVRVFPNPLRPSLGPSYATMNFTNLPPDARVRIFTAAGELVRDLRASAAGQAAWDARNEGGAAVASGTYLAVVENASGGGRKVRRVAVER